MQFRLIGVDANEATINHAKSLSANYKHIVYHTQDVFSDEFAALEYDIALSTLFLHHFDDDSALGLIKTLMNKASIGIVINDLQRSIIAYYLFTVISTIIGNPMVKTDGLISILRGYKRRELEKYAQEIGYKNSIKWKWAFRYQWTITKK